MINTFTNVCYYKSFVYIYIEEYNIPSISEDLFPSSCGHYYIRAILVHLISYYQYYYFV